MNLVSSHDSPRIRTIYATGKDGENMNREEQANITITGAEEQKADILQRLTAALQFTLPGVPCVYYGDEQGMHGLKDPFNRGTFVIKNEDLYTYYARLTSLREKYPALKVGDASFFAVTDDILGFLRYSSDENNAQFLVLVNKGDQLDAEIDLDIIGSCMSEKDYKSFKASNITRALSVPFGISYTVSNNRLHLPLNSLDFTILRLE